MKFIKYIFGALSLVASVALISSFFMTDIKPITQITFVIQSVGYGFVSGFGFGADLGG